MNLPEAIDSYVCLKQSLGAVFRSDARILRSFGKRVGDVALDTIDPEVCRSFCRGTGPPTRWWERKYYTLRAFFTFLVSRGYLAASPLPDATPRALPCFEPYVYSHEELKRLLSATATLEDPRTPLEPVTFRTLLLTLYGAGLRPSEGLRLRCCDVDLRERILAVWDTKFFKSRLVPIGTDLVTALVPTARCVSGCRCRPARNRPCSPPLRASPFPGADSRGSLFACAFTRQSGGLPTRAGNPGSRTFGTPLPFIGSSPGTERAPMSRPVCPCSLPTSGTSTSAAPRPI